MIIIVRIAFFAYDSLESDAINTNNMAIELFESGNSDQAIDELQKAVNSANFDLNKINTLKNLAIVYSSEMEHDLALKTYKEALSFADKNSFDYFLISGEIAYLENKPDSAYFNFNKAYELDSEDFQINNSLTAFYLDLGEVAINYTDYAKALKFAQKTHELEDVEFSRQNLGIAHYFNDNYDNAIFFLLKSNLDQEPHVALWLGLSYAAKEDVSNAEFYFQKAIDSGVEVDQSVHDYLVPISIGYDTYTYSEDVVLIQTKLQNLGYSIGIDGYFGSQTENAVVSFQKKNGLKQTGIVDEVTASYLFSE